MATEQVVPLASIASPALITPVKSGNGNGNGNGKNKYFPSVFVLMKFWPVVIGFIVFAFWCAKIQASVDNFNERRIETDVSILNMNSQNIIIIQRIADLSKAIERVDVNIEWLKERYQKSEPKKSHSIYD
jgi:hypothetical protein